MSSTKQCRTIIRGARERCPDCGLYLYAAHRCRVPVLLEAIGVPLTSAELAVVRILARGDHEHVGILAEIFRKVRSPADHRERQLTEQRTRRAEEARRDGREGIPALMKDGNRGRPAGGQPTA